MISDTTNVHCQQPTPPCQHLSAVYVMMGPVATGRDCAPFQLRGFRSTSSKDLLLPPSSGARDGDTGGVSSLEDCVPALGVSRCPAWTTADGMMPAMRGRMPWTICWLAAVAWVMDELELKVRRCLLSMDRRRRLSDSWLARSSEVTQAFGERSASGCGRVVV